MARAKPQKGTPDQLLRRLKKLRGSIYQEGQALLVQWCPHIQRRAFFISALNFAYYLALRRHDLRDLQGDLAALGLSSLGRSEPHVLPNLDAVLATLGALSSKAPKPLPPRPSRAAFFRGQRMLARNARCVLGAPPLPRRIRIMVTLPTEASSDYSFVLDLLKRGMDWARINCAHDDVNVWSAMIANLHRAESETGRPCKILMDIAGPKARTGKVRIQRSDKRVYPGDQLLLIPGKPGGARDADMQVQCLLPEVFGQLRVHDKVWIDDGLIGTQIEAVHDESAILRVIQARPKGEKLQPDKGLNFPDTNLELSPLTDKDRQDLPFITAYADAIGYSFVQSAADVELLQNALAEQFRDEAKCREFAIIAKIETAQAVRNFPEILVQAAGKQPFGVMIARGDLAVEIGYELLAEVQEELLWLCEAAYIPVIWATQVLETLVKKGQPSRAEMSDAALSGRAECVMLNKGPFVADAVRILDGVLTRMYEHQVKRMSQLPALHSWHIPGRLGKQ